MNSDELVTYAKKMAVIAESGIEKFVLLDKTKQVQILAEEILWCEFEMGVICPRPIPEDVLARIRSTSALYKDSC